MCCAGLCKVEGQAGAVAPGPPAVSASHPAQPAACTCLPGIPLSDVRHAKFMCGKNSIHVARQLFYKGSLFGLAASMHLPDRYGLGVQRILYEWLRLLSERLCLDAVNAACMPLAEV